MTKRSTRRQIRDKLERAAGNIDKAEGLMAECVASYFAGGSSEGVMVDQMREILSGHAQMIRDFRSTRT